MSPDQIQELINQQMQTAVAGAPFWMKALFLLQVLSMMVTVICLPLMVWKLFSLSKPSRGPEQSLAHDARLQEIRTRRAALEGVSGVTTQTPLAPEDDARFRPPQ